MERTIKTSMTALALSVGIAGAILGPAAANGGEDDGDEEGRGRDRVHGSAVNEFPTPVGPGSARVTARVSSGPAGERPRGFVQATGNADGTDATSFFVRGEVTCLRVSGGRAAIKYRFRRAEGTAEPFKGGGVQIFIEDNGEPRDDQPVDATANDPPQPAGVFDTNAAICDDPDTRTYDQVKSGDYTVSRSLDPGGGDRPNQQRRSAAARSSYRHEGVTARSKPVAIAVDEQWLFSSFQLAFAFPRTDCCRRSASPT